MGERATSWIEGLKNPDCYTHQVDHVQLIETHISWVVLTGCYAYKIKKPVVFSFVDCSTLNKRRWFCEEEVRLNRRLAPDLYLGVVPITGSPGSPCIDGQGVPFEYAVMMKQFSSESEIQEVLFGETTAEATVIQLADTIAEFHARLEKTKDDLPYGTPELVKESTKECLEEIPNRLLNQKTRNDLTKIDNWLQVEWQNVFDALIQRKESGFVRECHGDLHLGNIAILEGNICVFDALEFEPRLRWIDVMSEVAFLVMDLQKTGRRDLAFVFLNRYLEQTGDYSGLVVLRLYQVYRALVRAKVAGLRATQIDNHHTDTEPIRRELVGYLELANQFIKPPAPFLLLMHGVSGTGKTTVSAEIIKRLGGIRIRSDVERKRLNVGKAFNSEGHGQMDLYTSDMTRRTYNRLWELARILLHSGYSVVVDAAFLVREQRTLFLSLASEFGCPMCIVAMVAPQAVLAKRIQERLQKGDDASDATVPVMERQQETIEPFTPVEQSHVIRVDSTDSQSIVLAIKKLKEIAES